MERLPATVMYDPEPDDVLRRYQDQVNGMVAYAEALVIRDAAAVDGATNDLSMISSLKRQLEDRRKEYVGPLNNEVKEINALFKTLTEPLAEADSLTRKKILAWNEEQRRLKAEAEAINQQKIDLARREMELNGEITVDTTPVDVPTDPRRRIEADAGVAATAKLWKWEVIDFALVPDEYKMIDASKVGRVVRAGIRSIAGIRIYDEETLRVTPRSE